MSIDPFTGRNPSYSFVELASKQEADQAMVELNGRIMLRRPVKLGLGVARSQGKRPHGEKDREPHNAHNRPSPIFDRWTRTDVSEHWKGYYEQGRRCFVGGLPRMLDHETVNTDVRVLFKGYNM